MPVPYIESINFESDGLLPLFMTVRDSAQGTYYLDVSNKSQIAIVDEDGNSMVLDAAGIHFSTGDCLYDVSFIIDSLYPQIADLSNVSCSALQRRAEDISFNQTLFLRDQCGNTVSRAIRQYPQLKVGETLCTDIAVDVRSGRWDFDCTFPGAVSGTIRCQNAVQRDIINFVVSDPFNDDCASLPTIISTLSETANDILSVDSLQEALANLTGDANSQLDLDAAVNVYQNLWSALQEFFILPTSETSPDWSSPWERYISVYNANLSFSFETDICEAIHASEIPLYLSLTAGVTTISPLTTLNYAPFSTIPYNLTIQDSSVIACCANGTDSNVVAGVCVYPETALVGDTGCICGMTSEGASLAFQAGECENYPGTCETENDCLAGLACVVGTCCGEGVCVDPYACSRDGVELVSFPGLRR